MTNEFSSVWFRARILTRGAWVALAVAACGETTDGTQSAAVSDTASAYEALSRAVESCEDEKATCVTDANGDAAKQSACDAAAESCLDKTKGAQAEARRRLQGDAEGCVRDGRRARANGAGGASAPAGGGGSAAPGMQDCMRGRAPAQAGQCMDDFFACLDATGVRQSGGQTELDQAARDAVGKCVEAAHGCMMTQMKGRRRDGGPRGMGGAGHAAMGHAAGARAHAMGGGHAPRVDGAAGRHAPTQRSPRGEAGAGPGRHSAGGAGGGN